MRATATPTPTPANITRLNMCAEVKPEILEKLIELYDSNRPIIPQLNNTIYLLSLAYNLGKADGESEKKDMGDNTKCRM